MSENQRILNKKYILKEKVTTEDDNYLDDYANSILTVEELSEMKGALQIAEGLTVVNLDNIIKIINAKIAIHNLATKLDKA